MSIIGNHREIDSSNHKKRKGGRGRAEEDPERTAKMLNSYRLAGSW